MEEPFTTFDITKILGPKIDRLKDWLTRGYIEPSIQKATGQGTKNLFSLEDIYLIALFQNLVNRGFSREEASARIMSIRFLHRIANEVHRIRETKLNAAGLAQIKRDWARLDDIDVIIIGVKPGMKRPQSVEHLPLIEALRFSASGDRRCIVIDTQKYPNVEEITIVQFDLIRKRIDLAIEND